MKNSTGKRGRPFCWGILLVFLLNYAPAFSKISTTSDVRVSSMVPVSPVFVGLDTNPLLRLAVHLPAGKQINFRSIQSRLNETAVNDIEKLEVFYTGSEPMFLPDKAAATVKPASTAVNIPINITLEAGMHFFWISATLKASADIDNTIQFVAARMTDDQGGSYAVTGEKAAPPRRMGVAVRKAGEDGVDTYRIPGIATTDKGTLIAVYDIRYDNPRDLPGNIDVGMSRSTDGGRTWEPMQIIMDMGAPHENNGVGDPAVLFDHATGKIWVAALWSKGNRSIAGSKPGLSPDETGQFVLVSSSDDGETWSLVYNITEQVKNPKWNLFFNGPGSGIVMEDGRLVFAAQYWDENAMPHSTIIYSEDQGKSWKSGIGAKSNTTESQVIETTPGTLMLNMRDNRGSMNHLGSFGSFRTIATTTNMGQDWVEHQSSYNALPDPVVMASLIKTKVNVNGQQQEVVFFSNPNTVSGRYKMTIKASSDLAETWPSENQLLIDERDLYGYSSLTKVDEHTIGLLYEGIKDLYFVRIPVREIIKKK